MGRKSLDRSRYFRLKCAMEIERLLGRLPSDRRAQLLAETAVGEDQADLDRMAEAIADEIRTQIGQREVVTVWWQGDFPNANEAPPLRIDFAEGDVWEYDLRLGRGASHIQPGDRGLQSMLSRCLGLHQEQAWLNTCFERDRLWFHEKLESADEDSLRQLRGAFLGRVRDRLHAVLKDAAAKTPDSLRGYRPLLLSHPRRRMLVTSLVDGEPRVRSVSYPESGDGAPELARLGRDTVRLAFDNVSVLLRVKFESDHLSAVKVSVSAGEGRFGLRVDEAANRQYVDRALARVAKLDGAEDDSSTDVGTCFEALVALHLLRSSAAENRSPELADTLREHAARVRRETVSRLVAAAEAASRLLVARLADEHGRGELAYVLHDPCAYSADPRETRDLLLGWQTGNGLTEVGISLKVVAAFTGEIGTKNPGAGTLLGPTYFDLVPDDEARQVVEQIRAQFDREASPTDTNGDSGEGTAAHLAAIERLSDYVEEVLATAAESGSREGLLQGVSDLIGNCPLLIATYGDKPTCTWFDPRKHPSREVLGVRRLRPNCVSIETDQIRCDIRLKFASGTRRPGVWSSLKAFVTVRAKALASDAQTALDYSDATPS